MARPESTHYELTETERRDIIKLIEQGKPLPERYRFLLFEDKREVELVWNGKSREVCTAILPFQTLEHIDEPRKETAASSQLDLLDTSGRQVKGWANKLIWGDNKLILSSSRPGPCAARSRTPAASSSSTSIPPSTSARTSPWTSRSAAKPSTRNPTSSNKSPTAIPGAEARIRLLA